jgi:2-keto-myo-inositol isomerase
MLSRRESLKWLGAAALSAALPLGAGAERRRNEPARFVYCLNTSTIRGQGQGLEETIAIAAKAGYDGLELWIRDIQAYVEQGNSLAKLRGLIRSAGLTVEGAIAFPHWLVEDPEQRRAGLLRMEAEMNMLAELECRRIAAPPSGYSGPPLDLIAAGERFRQVIGLGRKTGVMPQLEFQGPSKYLYHLGQAMCIAVAADDPDARILPDVYHMYKGGSGFNGLKLIDGRTVELFHFNDYPGDIPRADMNDGHRVYPGDGIAPLAEIVADLYRMGAPKSCRWSCSIRNTGNRMPWRWRRRACRRCGRSWNPPSGP